MNRRDFFKTTAGLGGALLLPSRSLAFRSTQNPSVLPTTRREKNAWLRFYAANDPKFAAGIKILSNHSVESTCSSFVRNFATEYHLIGDVFIDENENIINSDWLEVLEDGTILLIPDDELRHIVFTKQPKMKYELVPERVRELVLQNKLVPLNDIKRLRSPTSHFGKRKILKYRPATLCFFCRVDLGVLSARSALNENFTDEEMDYAMYTIEKMCKIKNGELTRECQNDGKRASSL